jgi:hypothetical protein
MYGGGDVIWVAGIKSVSGGFRSIILMTSSCDLREPLTNRFRLGLDGFATLGCF